MLHEEWPEGVNPMRSEFDASEHIRIGKWTRNGGPCKSFRRLEPL